MSANARSTADAVPALLETWDDDGDFDLSDAPTADIMFVAPNASSESWEVATPSNDDLGRPDERGRDGDEPDDLDDEQADTLKVSDLTSETLAQLAAYAKKKQVNITAHPSDPSSPLFAPAHFRYMEQTGAGAVRAMRSEDGLDWDADLEIPDSLSMRSLKLRPNSFASDADFETPSLGSTSDVTSGSFTSDSHRGGTGHPVTPYRRRGQGIRSSASSVMSSAHLSPSHDARRSKGVEYPAPGEISSDDADLVIPDTLQTLKLSPCIARERSQENFEQLTGLCREDSASAATSISKSGIYRASPSISSGKRSDAERVSEENFDDLDFLGLSAAQEAQGQSSSFAEKLRARLTARKAVSHTNRTADTQIGGPGKPQQESELSSGLVITDDLDLSPSRLRARSLSNRLREAARQRRKRQEGKRKDGAGQQGKAPDAYDAKQKDTQKPSIEKQGDHADQAVAFPSGTSSRQNTPPSLRMRAGIAVTRARDAEKHVTPKHMVQTLSGRGDPLSVQNPTRLRTDSLTNSAAHILAQRPSTPSYATVTSGRVTPQLAGSMPYAMPTAASLARRSPTQQLSSPSTAMASQRYAATAKVMRQPRRARTYGDGRELDGFDDLPTNERAGQTNNAKQRSFRASDQHKHHQQPGTGTKAEAPPKIQQLLAPTQAASVDEGSASVKKKSRSRRKKQPFLIRNLGGAGKSAKMVGDMRWNPTLKQWEGNEAEGREFENAIRGTGRPALITQLTLGTSGMSFGGIVPASPPASVKPAAQTPTGLRSPNSGVRVVGDMMFDPIKLCWVRQDGEEEADPFDSLNGDGDEDEDMDGLLSDTPGTRSARAGQLRQRTVSAEMIRPSAHDLVANFSGLGSAREHDSPVLSQNDVANLVTTALRLKSTDVPLALRAVLPSDVWAASVEAQRLHERQMAGFVPQTQPQAVMRRGNRPFSMAGHSTTSSGVPDAAGYRRMDHREKTGHLYFIQSLARRAGRGS